MKVCFYKLSKCNSCSYNCVQNIRANLKAGFCNPYKCIAGFPRIVYRPMKVGAARYVHSWLFSWNHAQTSLKTAHLFVRLVGRPRRLEVGSYAKLD